MPETWHRGRFCGWYSKFNSSLSSKFWVSCLCSCTRFNSSLSSKFWVSCLAALGLILFCPVNSAFPVCLAANLLSQGSESMVTSLTQLLVKISSPTLPVCKYIPADKWPAKTTTTRTWISNHCRCPAHGLNGWCWNDHIIKIDWHDVWMVHVSWSPQSEACPFFSTCLQIQNDLSVHVTQGEALEVDSLRHWGQNQEVAEWIG